MLRNRIRINTSSLHVVPAPAGGISGRDRLDDGRRLSTGGACSVGGVALE
jgi:hypothetical protein